MQSLYKTLTSINILLSGLVIVMSFNIPEILVRFLLVGELPDGTTLLSPDTMLAIIIIGFVITCILISPSFIFRQASRLARSSTNLRLPKHRYSSLQ